MVVQNLEPKDKPKCKAFAEVVMQNFDTEFNTNFDMCHLPNLFTTDKTHFCLIVIIFGYTYVLGVFQQQIFFALSRAIRRR